MAKLLLGLVLAANVLEIALSACSVSGCQPDRCHCASIEKRLTPSPPAQIWSKHVEAIDAGCLTNGGMIVCPLNTTRSILKGGLMSTDADNKHSWTSHELGAMPLPVVDLEGAVIATDGYTLAGYTPVGKVLGVTALFPTTGYPLDLTYTANDLVLITYQCGLLAAYLTNGVPHASIWLNDTVSSQNGTFVPLIAPAFVLDRFYLLTAFWPHDNTAMDTYTVRLYAIDLQRVMVERFKTAWYLEVTGKGQVPTVGDRFQSCTYKRPGETMHPSHSPSLSPVVGDVMAINETVVAYVKTVNSGNSVDASIIMSVNDTGDTYEKNFVTTTSTLSPLISISHPPYQLENSQQILPIFVVSFGDKVQLVDQYKGTVAAQWDMAFDTQLSTPPLLLQNPGSPDSFYMITGHSSVVGTAVMWQETSWQAKQLWSIATPGKNFATVYDGNQSLLVVSTSDGQLSTYQI